MQGYQGKILHVDLTRGEHRTEALDEDFARKYLGGNGFAARYLWDLTKPGVDALSPENVIVFAVGPYTDSAVPSASRACAGSKSPLTDLFFDSTFGGAWPATMKRAGFDAIVLHGRAESPVYLSVADGEAVIRDAGD
ncbi:MAG: aldehyde ferredoxin oxidoreductase N-terminal domain-containing protein, partial [bacterium]